MSNNTNTNEIIKQLNELRLELEREFERLMAEKSKSFKYTLHQGKVRFSQEVHAVQKQYKINLWKYISAARLGHIISAPIIYSLVVPFVLLDIAVTLYQHTCFRLYGINRVKRSDYLVIDRQLLGYLNILEKLNCIYCGYCGGVLAYVREVAARTEQYWCPIKHARRTPDPHRLNENFVDYGDADSYRERLTQLQADISKIDK